MNVYELRCLNQDGQIETNGFFLNLKDAEEEKRQQDNYPMNRSYGIEQSILTHEVKE